MIKHFFVYGLGNVLAGVIPFLLLPFLTANLNPAQMGTIAFIESIIMLCAPLIMLGIDGSYGAFYNKSTAADQRKLVTSLLILSGVASLLLLPVAIVVAYMKLLPIDINGVWIFALVFVFYTMAINALAGAQFQMEGKSFHYALIKVVSVLCAALITVVAISQFKLSIEGRLLGIYLGPILVGVFWLAYLLLNKEYNFFPLRPDLIKKGFEFGVGMLFHSWSAIIFFASDRIIIGYLVGSEDLGEYSVAAQIGMIMALAQNTFSQVWTPHTFKFFADRNLALFDKQSRFSILGLLLVSVIFALLTPLLYKYFIDVRYSRLSTVTYWIIATYFFLGIYKVFVVKFFYFEKTKTLALITTMCSLLNIVLTSVFVLKMGVIGGAIATCLSSIVFALIVYQRSKLLC